MDSERFQSLHGAFVFSPSGNIGRIEILNGTSLYTGWMLPPTDEDLRELQTLLEGFLETAHVNTKLGTRGQAVAEMYGRSNRS